MRNGWLESMIGSAAPADPMPSVPEPVDETPLPPPSTPPSAPLPTDASPILYGLCNVLVQYTTFVGVIVLLMRSLPASLGFGGTAMRQVFDGFRIVYAAMYS